jgi:hypothetical protein
MGHKALVDKISAKHKLPEELAARLKGNTEEELEADAAYLASIVKTPTAPITEGGNKSSFTSSENKNSSEGSQKRPYIFQKPGEVGW